MLPKIKTILYATGLGPNAPYVFRYALAFARQHQADIVAVHAVEPLSRFGQSLVEQYISHDVSEEMHKKARETVKAQLQQRIEQLCANECSGTTEDQNPVTSIQVVEGYPSQVVMDVARKCSADMIIMGSHHHTPIGDVILGHTTRKVLHATELPVLVVKIPEDLP
jgi:nucleotide-binding universal stress UspA family protein